MAQATYDDANLLLRLYELRREEKMREARAWFIANFKPKTLADVMALCPPGSADNAKMRMVMTYWEMVASFVTSAVLNAELLFANNREMLAVWLRLERVLGEMRVAYKEPNYFKNLETVGKQFIDYLNKTSPGSVEAFTARVVGS
jgi:hypothetical protein